MEQVIPEHEKIADKEFEKLENKLAAEKGKDNPNATASEEYDPILQNIKPKPDK